MLTTHSAWFARVPFRLLACGLLFAVVCIAFVAAPPARDPLERDTPRDAIRAFLDACHNARYVQAAQYLDLSRIPKSDRAVQGPELARELARLLDRDLDFELEELDNTPEGRSDDGMAHDIDRLARLQIDGHSVSLFLARTNQNGRDVWIVAADSVAHIAQWAASVQGPAIEKSLPPALVTTKLLGTAVWSWIGMVLLAVLLSALSRALSKLAVALFTRFARRYAPWLSSYRLETFIGPLRLLLSIAVFRASLEVFAPSALMREYLLGMLALLAVAGAASVVMRVVDVVSDQMITRLGERDRGLSYSVVSLAVRFVKICIFAIAILVVLDQWGVRITTILAGLGVGGLAVALAAQKTLENLFGGISIITDRPVLVGDFCQFGGQVGTVADIGLRSTRIRTLDRTLVTIPNSQFSTMTIENFSVRDRIFFKPVLRLRRDTTPEQIRVFMQAVEQILRDHEKVDPTTVPVRFTSIDPDSYKIEIFSYVLTTDINEFLKQQTLLLLRFLEVAEQLGIGFALPVQENVMSNMTSAVMAAATPQ